MVIEILGAIAADAAGESMHKSKEKKKLEDTKDNPEEHARVLEEIEKRKERNNKAVVYLVCLFLLILLSQSSPALGMLFIVLIMYLWPKTTGKKSDTIPDSKTSSGTISPSERQALMSRKCSVPGCNIGNFRMTDYCHKHQDHIPSNSEPETEEEENWWEEKTE